MGLGSGKRGEEEARLAAERADEGRLQRRARGEGGGDRQRERASGARLAGREAGRGRREAIAQGLQHRACTGGVRGGCVGRAGWQHAMQGAWAAGARRAGRAEMEVELEVEMEMEVRWMDMEM